METTKTEMFDSLVEQIRLEEREIARQQARDEIREELRAVLDGNGAVHKAVVSNGHAKNGHNKKNSHVKAAASTDKRKTKPRTAAQIAASQANIAKARETRLAKLKAKEKANLKRSKTMKAKARGKKK